MEKVLECGMCLLGNKEADKIEKNICGKAECKIVKKTFLGKSTEQKFYLLSTME